MTSKAEPEIDTRAIRDLPQLAIASPKRTKCCISLSWTWYTLLTDFAQTYLIVQMIKRLLQLPNTLNAPQPLLIAYFLILMSLIGLLIVFTLTSTRQTGNYCNDGYKFGRCFLTEHRRSPNILHQIWRHFLPINALTHYLIAAILLYSNLYLIYRADEITKTNTNASLFSNLTFTNNNLIDGVIVQTILAENLLPELINYAVAAIVLCIKYAQVFWLVNKFLTFVISFVGLLNLIEQIFQFFTLNYLALFLKNHADASTQGLIIKTDYLLIYLHFVLKIFIIVSLVPLYIFVYLKYKERFFYEKSVLMAIIETEEPNLVKNEQPDASSSPISSNSSKKAPEGHLKFYFNYCPHLCAVVLLSIIFMFKVLFCYDMITLFNEYRNSMIMFAIIYEIIHLIVLIFVWFLLTLKLKWSINYQFSFKLTQFYVLFNELRANCGIKVSNSAFKLDKDVVEKGVDVVDVKDGLENANEAAPKYIAKSTTQESHMNDSEAVYRNEIRKSINNLFFSSYNNYYNLKPTIRLKKSLSKSYFLNRNSAGVDDRVMTQGGYLNPQMILANHGHPCIKSSSSSLISNNSPGRKFVDNNETPVQRSVRSVPTTVSWAVKVPRRPVLFLNEDFAKESSTPVAVAPSAFYTEYESRV